MIIANKIMDFLYKQMFVILMNNTAMILYIYIFLFEHDV